MRLLSLVVQRVTWQVWTYTCRSSQSLVRALRLRDDDVGVVQERTRTQMIVVDTLSVSLQVALHVFWIEREVGAQHG